MLVSVKKYALIIILWYYVLHEAKLKQNVHKKETDGFFFNPLLFLKRTYNILPC